MVTGEELVAQRCRHTLSVSCECLVKDTVGRARLENTGKHIYVFVYVKFLVDGVSTWARLPSAIALFPSL